MKSYHTQQRVSLIFRYILLAVLAIIWIIPIVWMVLTSFANNHVGFVSTFFPKQWTLGNYSDLFRNPSGSYPYVNWLINTFVVALISAVIATFITIIMSYTLSRLKFAFRKPFLQIALVLGMFPGFMSMIALYYILKSLHLLSLGGLVLVYVGGAGLAFYIAKGFFDTVPYAIDEAAVIDGATKWQIFTHITLPLSRPIIVYTALMAFMGPWMDFIFAGIILGTDQAHPQNFTIAYGLYNMVNSQKGAATQYFTDFVAGCVLIAVPITIIFVIMQKFYVNGITAGADKG